MLDIDLDVLKFKKYPFRDLDFSSYVLYEFQINLDVNQQSMKQLIDVLGKEKVPVILFTQYISKETLHKDFNNIVNKFNDKFNLAQKLKERINNELNSPWIFNYYWITRKIDTENLHNLLKQYNIKLDVIEPEVAFKIENEYYKFMNIKSF